MALTDENGNGMVMPVAPMYGGNGGGFGNFGGDWGWIILLLLIAGGGWGNGWGGFGNGVGGFAADGAMLYPWMNQAEITTQGFQNASIGNQLTAIQGDINGVQTQLCNGFAGVNATVSSGFANAETAANSRQMANMQQAFNSQIATMQGFNAVQSQFADCCCENRLANCQTQNIIQNEGNATRFADANNTRDLLTNQTANTQAILDKLCQLELDAKNDKISDLERQLTMANLAASQTAQTSRILADNAAQTVALEQYLNPVPVPAYVVQNPNCCTNGCGCGSF